MRMPTNGGKADFPGRQDTRKQKAEPGCLNPQGRNRMPHAMARAAATECPPAAYETRPGAAPGPPAAHDGAQARALIP